MNDQSNKSDHVALGEAATSAMLDSTIVDSVGAAANTGLAIGNADSGANSRPTATATAHTNSNANANANANTVANPVTQLTAPPVAQPVAHPGTASSEPGMHADGQNEFHMKLVSSRRREHGMGRGVGERRERQRGIGVMGPRVRDPDGSSPPREVVDEAKSAARSSGHRFDLMRYLRLRRKG